MGSKWGGALQSGATITYSFLGPDSFYSSDPFSGYGPNFGSGEPWDAFALTPTQQSAFQLALQEVSSVANVTFVEVADSQSLAGDIRIGFSNNLDADASGWAYGPSGSPKGGDIWLNGDSSGTIFADVSPGTFGFKTLLHELGHALGLKHPFDATGSGVTLPSGSDDYSFTLMSYTAWRDLDDSALSLYPNTMSAYDVYALQYLYGPNTSYHAGDDTYLFYSGGAYSQTVWDAGGSDTIQYLAPYYDGARIDLDPGSWSDLGNSITIYGNPGLFSTSDTVRILGSVTIENAIGGDGPDTLIGNGVANSLQGGLGNDTLRGGADSDTLRGGGGSDEIRGGGGDDFQYAGAGNDSLYGGPGNDSSRGGPDADVIRSGGGDDTVYGGLGNDTLYGGPGSDLLTGGAGADRFWFGSAAASDADTILDFESGVDKIQLDPAYFTASSFGVNVLYEAASVYYDADGSGLAASPALVASLVGTSALAAGDFLISP